MEPLRNQQSSKKYQITIFLLIVFLCVATGLLGSNIFNSYWFNTISIFTGAMIFIGFSIASLRSPKITPELKFFNIVIILLLGGLLIGMALKLFARGIEIPTWVPNAYGYLAIICIAITGLLVAILGAVRRKR